MRHFARVYDRSYEFGLSGSVQELADVRFYSFQAVICAEKLCYEHVLLHC